MKRFSTALPNDGRFVERLAFWSAKQSLALVFTGHGWNHGLVALAAIGVSAQSERTNGLDVVSFQQKQAEKDVFCHFNYDVKNDLEQLDSHKPDAFNFPHCFAFVPRITLEVHTSSLKWLCWDININQSEVEALLFEIASTPLEDHVVQSKALRFQIDRQQYLDDLKKLKAYIQRGDVYQGNYCQSFFWDDAELNPAALFNEGHRRFPNPFAVYYKLNTHHLMSFSPERFLAIEGDRIYSQPMKGTMPRGKDNVEDDANRIALSQSEKDRRENVMIVDMVRNDLSHYAEKGSVQVPELYRIETYPKVHQMYSTVEARLKSGTSKIAALLKAFPMGSMTGAPKVRAMECLEKLEHNKRGIYSGTVGYIRSDKRADFNVVIRSLIYSESTKTLGCAAGGGITALSEPEAEWDECMVKVQPLFDLISESQPANQSEPLPLNNARPIL